jgi:hypothetical protein
LNVYLFGRLHVLDEIVSPARLVQFTPIRYPGARIMIDIRPVHDELWRACYTALLTRLDPHAALMAADEATDMARSYNPTATRARPRAPGIEVELESGHVIQVLQACGTDKAAITA